MLKLITKVELLREGKSGFELSGLDVIRNTEHSKISDNIVRTRTLPVPFWSRDLFHALRYPVLVYTRHWLPLWDSYLTEDKMKLDNQKIANYPKLKHDEWVIAKLQNIWKETTVHSIEDTPQGFKVIASIVMGGKNNRINCLIDEEADSNIYLRTQELFETICEEFAKLMTQNILPATSEEIKQIAGEIDQNLELLTDDQMLGKILELAEKRNVQIGFSVDQIMNALPDIEDDTAVITSIKTEAPHEFEKVEMILPPPPPPEILPEE
jgi:hypothetical protein